ncbi:hypothetical protein PlfCFBP13513_08635 [Plantibacter flavus]|uniref:hypothetical protein n=1 Tax=Plantibacter flavus TaxID=150123 RepID=UPI0010C1AEFA|nr:hypothetical protein [Plantibacter flavus]TKJ99434.1 hypothetical protein PlfCFBP13513_08635 [Plantibacter flavus]
MDDFDDEGLVAGQGGVEPVVSDVAGTGDWVAVKVVDRVSGKGGGGEMPAVVAGRGQVGTLGGGTVADHERIDIAVRERP